ncbi:zinc finger protein 335 [Anopheles maculipalpis]|uniref:zinc finger protein 335 n=1 Tax=Anopheles maculipalpis TaxID=1496333 RepID=UPI0021594247|nr:zinc finger protein 335 [Anopheles maculipalpis]
MLNEEDTELDDTHLCIKCGSTVEGIENYIKHRKVNCAQPAKSSGGTDEASAAGANADQATVALRVETASTTEPAPYGTFDFTETIKEPEHHKKVPGYDYHNYELEPHHHHHHHTDPEHHRSDGSKATDYKNEVNYEYELGADLFFSSLELQSSSKQKTTTTQPGVSTGSGGVVGGGCSPATKIALLQSRPKTRKFTTSLVTPLEPDQQQQQQQQQQHHQLPDDWLATPNESDKLMKAVSDISGHKKVELYPIFHQESPDPSDDDSEDEEDYNAPPRTHTGGKWKPENRPSPNVLRSTSHWRHWPPESPLDKSIEHEEEDDSLKSFSPPPGHTKGKWVPGSKITRLEYKPSHEPVKSYEDNYWCSICNRRLASRFVYERHLKSNLHLKRAQEEFELERAIKPPLYANELSKQLRDQPCTERTGTVAQAVDEVTTASQLTDSLTKVKRKRKCYYTKCVVCQTRLPTHLLGKHLISRYHYRRMLNHPEQCFDVVLKNMHRIVLQSPFQCQPCKFYANNEVYFMEHWRSPEHEARVASSGKFWCSFCKFECEGNFQMTEHLLGASHREVIAVINRSVPIIIRKITRIRCHCCEQEFRYNAELRQHQRHCTAVSEETIEEVRAKVQNTFTCELCSATFPNRIRLLQHGQKLHRLANYYCSICECSFETAHDSMQHRRTSKHKVMSARKNRKSSLAPKTCSICEEKLPDVLELKQHIASNHPEVKYSCPQCGECFVLAQELGRHVRDKNCTFFNSSTVPASPSTSSALFVPYTAPEVLTIPAPSTSTSTPTTTTTTHQLTGALPAIVPQAETSPSSATRPHLSGTNSIISNDSIKVNMNDRKLGKETHLYSSTVAPFRETSTDRESGAEPESSTDDADGTPLPGSADEPRKELAAAVQTVDMMENYSPANRAQPFTNPASATTPSYRIKLESFSSALSSSAPTARHRQPGAPASTVVSNTDCDNIVAARSPQASAEIFFAMANNASENNTVYVDEIVGTIGEDGSVVCWQCKICPFRTSSQAEFLFHEILHSSKLDDKAKSSPSGSSTPGKGRCPKITCPLCGKAFSKASLRCHLRQHTDERLFPCAHCPMAFTRKANLKNHIDNIHQQQRRKRNRTEDGNKGEGNSSALATETAGPSRRAICTSCGKSFANRYIMQYHSRVHHDQRSVKKFACQHEGCHYVARSAADAQRHLLSHTTERNFACGDEGCDYRGKSLAQLRRHALRHHEEMEKKHKCDQCDFATRILGHLRRHRLVHTGSKPYSCPHCDYTCNNIENLRKHVISTSKHKGKFLYECTLCPRADGGTAYGFNFQKEYKEHLQNYHKLSSDEVKALQPKFSSDGF